MKNKVKIVILAAGHGKRMGQDIPKVLVPLAGKPMICRILDACEQSELTDTPTLVVGHGAEQIVAVLGDDLEYVYQLERLGTGHAVATTRPTLEGKHDHIMVLYGDHPYISPQMLDRLAQTHLSSESTLTMATAIVPDFEDWRQGFRDFGRIVRDIEGKVERIVEVKDATPEQKEIKEVNPAYFCFKASWLWTNLSRLHNNNNQQEYYLTDLVAMACAQGEPIATVKIRAEEALGANTPEQLGVLENLTASPSRSEQTPQPEIVIA